MSDEILLERLLDDSYPGYLESEQQLIDIQNKIKDRIDRFEALKNEDRSHRIREAAASAPQDGDSGFTLPGIDLFAEYNSTAAADGGAALETGEDDAFFGSFSDAFSGNVHAGRNAPVHERATGNSFDEESDNAFADGHDNAFADGPDNDFADGHDNVSASMPDNAFADAFADVFAEAHGDAHSETSFKASREMFSQETASADEDFPDQFTLFDAAEIFTDKTPSAVIPSGEAFSGGAEKTSRAAAEQSREPVKTHTQNIFGQGPAEGRSEEYAQRPVTEGAFEKQNPWTTVEPSKPAAEIAKPGEEQPKPSAEWPRTAEQPKTTDEEQSEKPAEESSEEQIRAEDLPGEKVPKEEPAAGTSGEGDRSFDSILDSVRDRLRDKPKPAATSAAPGTRSDKRAGDAFSGRDSGRDPYREPKAAPQGAPGNPMKEPAGTAPNDREKEPARTAPNDREKEPAKAASGNSVNPVNEPVKREIHNRGSANAGSQNREHADPGRRGTAGINPERDMYNAPSGASSGASSGAASGASSGASSGAYPGAASGASSGAYSGAPSDEKSRQSVIRVKKNRRYQLPPLDLVKPTDRDDNAADNEDLYTLEAERNAEKLKTTLRNFGIGVRITGITRGPAVTRFEFKPDEGIKISRIVALTNDIA
ncbi:MAG: hypothetical protein ILO53_05710, partial [Clostridia bacterium]|nr:hypothetical protein [Clostridia bacterium]